MAPTCSHSGPCQPGCHNYTDKTPCIYCKMPVRKPSREHPTRDDCILALGIAITSLKLHTRF